jgi:tripartite-type tricarboxylate transporter receptor subunit TctC
MALSRRRLLRLAAGAAVLPCGFRLASAQSYPARPVRLIVGFAAGGASDILARLLGHWLSERLGRQFIIENRPGAGTNIATESVVRAPPDGYTLLFVSVTNVINATLYDRLTFNFVRDIASVAGIVRQPSIMMVNPSLPAKTVPEFISYAKANPSRLNYASIGIGSSNHVTGELFKMMTGIDMVHVPYRGGAPALTDLIAGQVQVMFIGPVGSLQYVKDGQLRALAVTTTTRAEALPNIPTVSDFVPGFEASSWFGIGAPRNTPREIANKLNEEINAGLADPKIKARLAELGGMTLAGSPADFGQLITDETEKWAKVIRIANVKPE